MRDLASDLSSQLEKSTYSMEEAEAAHAPVRYFQLWTELNQSIRNLCVFAPLLENQSRDCNFSKERERKRL